MLTRPGKAAGTKGFTLLEIIVSVTVVAIIMIPLALMMIEFVRSIAYADGLTMAASLGQREMAIVDSASYTTVTSRNQAPIPDYPAFDLNRVVTNDALGTGSGVKKIEVTVSPHASGQTLATFSTYRMDIPFGVGSYTTSVASLVTVGAGTMIYAVPQVTISAIPVTASAGATMVSLTVREATSRPAPQRPKLTGFAIDGIAVASGTYTVTTADLQVAFEPKRLETGAHSGQVVFTDMRKNTRYRITMNFVMSDGSKRLLYSDFTTPKN